MKLILALAAAALLAGCASSHNCPPPRCGVYDCPDGSCPTEYGCRGDER